MPLPKSLTSLLTAIVVAIPAAITTLALNKPKPPKEIDEVITLEENTEIIVEKEIEPQPEPTLSKPPQIKPSGTPASGPLSSDGDSSGGTGTSSGSSDSQNSLPESEDEDDVDLEEKEDAAEGNNDKKDQQENEEEKAEDENTDSDPEQSPDPTDEQKDIPLEELKKSIEETIKKIIEEGSNFNAQDSRLYKLYIIQISLDSLPKLIASLQTKIEEEKNKDATKGSVDPGSSSETGGQSK